MRGASIMPIYGIFRSNRASQEESDSLHFLFLFQIPYISEEKQDSELVFQTQNGKFPSDQSDQNKWTTSRDDPKYSS